MCLYFVLSTKPQLILCNPKCNKN